MHSMKLGEMSEERNEISDKKKLTVLRTPDHAHYRGDIDNPASVSR